jgi:hypothetical protein
MARDCNFLFKKWCDEKRGGCGKLFRPSGHYEKICLSCKQKHNSKRYTEAVCKRIMLKIGR